MRIDLVGTTADFRRFGHPQTLPINHLLCENRRTQGRMGEVGLGQFRILSGLLEKPFLADYLVDLIQTALWERN